MAGPGGTVYAYIPPPPIPGFYSTPTNQAAGCYPPQFVPPARPPVEAVDGNARPFQIPAAAAPFLAIPPPPLGAAQLPNGYEVPPLAIYHICRVCLRTRSARYHREHPIPANGVPPPPGICRRCRVTPVGESRHAAEVVTAHQSNDIKLGFIAPFVPDEAIVSNEAMRRVKDQREVRIVEQETYDSRRNHKSRRTDVEYRYVNAEDTVKETRTSRNHGGAIIGDSDGAQDYEYEYQQSRPSRKQMPLDQVVTKWDVPFSSLFATRYIVRNGLPKQVNGTKAVQAPRKAEPRYMVRRHRPNTAAQASAHNERTDSNIRQIARDEIDRYHEERLRSPQRHEYVRHIARDEVERYRQAERKLERHPDPYAHGRMVSVERWDDGNRQTTNQKQRRSSDRRDNGRPARNAPVDKGTDCMPSFTERENITQKQQRASERRHSGRPVSNASVDKGTDCMPNFNERGLSPPKGLNKGKQNEGNQNKETQNKGKQKDTAPGSGIRVETTTAPVNAGVGGKKGKNAKSTAATQTATSEKTIKASNDRTISIEIGRGTGEIPQSNRSTAAATNNEEQQPLRARAASSSSNNLSLRRVETIYETSGSGGTPDGPSRASTQKTKGSSRRQAQSPTPAVTDRPSKRGGQDKPPNTNAKKQKATAAKVETEDEAEAEAQRIVKPGENVTVSSTRAPSPRNRRQSNNDTEYLYAWRTVQPVDRPPGRRPFDDHSPDRRTQVEKWIETERHATIPSRSDWEENPHARHIEVEEWTEMKRFPPPGRQTQSRASYDCRRDDATSPERMPSPSDYLMSGALSNEQSRHESTRKHSSTAGASGATSHQQRDYLERPGSGTPSAPSSRYRPREPHWSEAYERKTPSDGRNASERRRNERRSNGHDERQSSRHDDRQSSPRGLRYSNRDRRDLQDRERSNGQVRSTSNAADDSHRVRFSKKVDYSPTPPDSEDSSAAFRSYSRMGDRREHRRKHVDGMFDVDDEDGKYFPPLAVSETRARMSSGYDSNAPSNGHGTSHRSSTKSINVHQSGHESESNKTDGRRSRQLLRALSESPSRERSISSFNGGDEGGLYDGAGPYREMERPSGSLRVENGWATYA